MVYKDQARESIQLWKEETTNVVLSSDEGVYHVLGITEAQNKYLDNTKHGKQQMLGLKCITLLHDD